MAFTLGNLVGFETDGLDEALAIAGSPVVQATTKRSGNFALAMARFVYIYNVAPLFDTNGEADTFDASTLVAQVGFAFLTADVSVAALGIAVIRDSDDDFPIQIILNTDGTLRLFDAAPVAYNGSTVLKDNTWHYIELIFTLNATTGLLILKLDGVEEISVTGKDTFKGSSVWKSLELRGNLTAEVFFDDVYTATDVATDGSDTYADFEVFMYQSAHATDQDVGDALSVGTWDLAGQTPLDESAGNRVEIVDVAANCDTDFDDGARAGPRGDPRASGLIQGAKLLFPPEPNCRIGESIPCSFREQRGRHHTESRPGGCYHGSLPAL